VLGVALILPAHPHPHVYPRITHHRLEDRDAAGSTCEPPSRRSPTCLETSGCCWRCSCLSSCGCSHAHHLAPTPECRQAGGRLLYWHECAEHLLPACARLRRRPTGARKAGGQDTQGGGAMQHAGLARSALCCSVGCQQLCRTGDARRELWPRNCRRACLTTTTQPCTVLGCSLSDP
jgi:hypothetical protein